MHLRSGSMVHSLEIVIVVRQSQASGRECDVLDPIASWYVQPAATQEPAT
jgi:hypothetical protein